ncbi:MAG TPA: hypothetical protein VG326_17340 [Tepidisphaeraceae bacterium]|nr:hypothetical protein [Tepidisphaeraceae bacterium]
MQGLPFQVLHLFFWSEKLVSRRLRRQASQTGLLLALAIMTRASSAAPILVNGSFSGTAGQLTVNATLSGWTGGGKEDTTGSQTTPPVYVFGSTQGYTGVTGDAFMGDLQFPGIVPFSPSGHNFIAADGEADYAGSISQTIGGLTVGQQYTFAFNWAGVQRLGYADATTEQWQVTFGGSTQSTAIVNTPEQSFLGWQTASLDFIANSPSQLLTFQSVGTPIGPQPFSLLDNVTMTATPEPTSVAMLAIPALLGLLRRRAGRSMALLAHLEVA